MTKETKKKRPSTKEQYETIEELTPVKKILHDQEKDLEKTIETNQSGQRTQLIFVLNIPFFFF